MARAGPTRLMALAAAGVALAGCGHRFPFGERLLPESYGPPYGRGLAENLPHHPHNPAAGERVAEPDEAQNRVYGSYARCRSALSEELGRKQAGAAAVDVSAREAVGHAAEGDVVHEYRCVGPTLSYRAWHRGGEGGGHGGEERH